MSKKEEPRNETSRAQRFYQDIALKPIGNLVRPFVKNAIPKQNVIFQQVFDFWPDLVKNTEAVGSVPEKLVFAMKKQDNAVLHIWAQSGAQAMEMNFNKTSLIQRINTVFGYHLVGDIRLTAHSTRMMPKKSAANPANVNSTQGLSSQSLDKILTDISNPTLRTILRDLGAVLSPETAENPDNRGTDNA